VKAIPVDEIDFYSDEVIATPWPHYARLRALGPVVYLAHHDNFALVHHDVVLAALRDHDTFISGGGVAADEAANELTRGNSAASDGARHHAIRQATSPPLLPGALEKVRPLIDEAAEKLVDQLVAKGQFDSITDFATHLPLAIVRDLVGLPDFGRENMLRWANATFDLLGVQNERGRAAIEVFLEQRRFAQTQTPDMLKEGSWTKRLFNLVEQGLLSADLAPVAMRDYLNPSLDTTISATGQLIYQLGRNPDQWKLLRSRPDLARNAANEAVRMASPVRSFVRHTSREVEVAGHIIPEGARVMMVFASANRDDRAFERPDEFDITRNPRHHLGFGSGIHMCVGMHLAQMEMIALLEAMIPRVESIEVGEAVPGLNNTIHGFASLPARFIAPAVVTATTKEADREHIVKETTLRARIVDRTEIAEGVVCLKVEPCGGSSFPDWSAGAHVDVHIRPGTVRQYSLTGLVERGRYTIAVQLEPASRGGSAAIHAGFGVGEEVVLSLPRNHFPLHEDAEHSLLFSGGIGITPILAMAYRLHALGKEFAWHVSARSQSRLPWGSELASLPFADRICVHLDDGPEDQWLDAGAALSRADLGTHVYVCGPPGYMDYVKKAADSAGLSREQVHSEHFGAEIDINGDPFTVVTARTGLRIPVAPNESIVTALARAGIEVETGCQNGVCGTCLTSVISGRPDHRDMILTDTEKAENDRIALCCSRSQSAELVLDL